MINSSEVKTYISNEQLIRREYYKSSNLKNCNSDICKQENLEIKV